MDVRQQVVNKMNEGQEFDTKIYSWDTIPKSLRIFWIKYFEQQKKLT